MANQSRRWQREELLLAYDLYCRTPFGKLHNRNPSIIELSRLLNRTASALAMKLVNFASLDDAQQNRGVKGLANASAADRRIVNEFQDNWDDLVYEVSLVKADLFSVDTAHNEGDFVRNENENIVTEGVGVSKQRVVQSFFRSAILSSYDSKCAICEISHPELLVASHIIPWAICDARRADPTNGLCLCAIHDRAFDRGLLAVDEQYRVVLGKCLKQPSEKGMYSSVFGEFSGKPIRLPNRHHPDRESLRYHFNNIFK